MSTSEIKYKLGMDVGNVPSASAQAARSIEGIGKAGQVSAAQTAAAMRTLPAQFTDIATQLQGGANPLTVLLQQGGQIKDSFGGVGPAARALVGSITPAGVAIAGVAATVGVMVTAWAKGNEEIVAFENAMRLTGNAAGFTKASYDSLVDSLADVASVTKGTAREAALAVASSGLFNATTATDAARGITLFAKAMGTDAVKAFQTYEQIQQDASGTALKLNERFHFLTPEVYALVTALEQQGSKSEAAAVVMRSFNEVMLDAQPRLTALGEVTHSVTGFFDDMFESMKRGLATTETTAEALDRVRSRIAQMRTDDPFKGSIKDKVNYFFYGEEYLSGQMMGAKADEQAMADEQARLADRAKRAQENARKIEADRYLAGVRRKSDPRYRLNAAMDEFNRNAANASTPLSGIERAAMEHQIRMENMDRSALASYEASLSLRVASEKAASTLRMSVVEDEEGRLSAARSAGLIGVEEYERRKVEIQRKRLGERAQLIEQEIALEARRRPADEAGRLNQQGKLVGLRADLASVRAESERVQAAGVADAAARSLEAARQSAKDFVQVGIRTEAMIEQLAMQSATGMAMLITDPIARAKAEAEVTVQALLRTTERMRTEIQNQIDLANGSALQAGERGDTDTQLQMQARAASMQSLLQQLQTRTEEAAAGIRSKAIGGAINEQLKTDIGQDLAAGFDKASQSLGVFVQGFGKMVDEQERYNKIKRAEGASAEQLAKNEMLHTRAQLSGYASLAGAARGFMSEKTAGYKALMSAEQALRALELASATQRITSKLAEGQAVAAVGVANQAAGDPYTALPRMATMAAAMAALGFAVTGGFGGGGGGFAETNSGTGTVLGDGGAKSDSLVKGIEALRDVDTLTMRYSAQMLASLQSIESNIGGLASLVVQSGAIGSAAGGVQTGFKRDAIGNGISMAYDVMSSVIKTVPVFGDVMAGINTAIGNLVSNLFGTKTSIQGQGISAGAQSLTSILANGFNAQYYTDIEEKSKFLGITTSTSRRTQYTEADAQLERQIGSVFAGFASAVREAAGPLGVSLGDVKTRIESFVVQLGRIDLKGLSGTQIQERLTSVFGAQGDLIASAVLGGFESFQKVGEGYLTTIARTASSVEIASAALRRLGITSIGLADVQNKQGDVAAELVRQSIMAKEGVSSLTQMLATLGGSASDIAGTYTSLVDVRTSLKLMGLSASAVSRDLIDGAGGLQSLTDSLAAYATGFTSRSQQVDAQAQRVALQFERLGLSMPKSATEFVSLVKGIDTSTEAGRLLLGSVLSLSGGFADLMDAIKSTGGGIAEEIERIKGLSATGAALSLSEQQALFAIKSAQARAGDQIAIDDLPKISQALLQAAEATASSSLQYKLLQGSTLASLQETLAMITDPTKRLGRIPGFATGGFHRGGLRVVGETGAELEATGPARYYSAGQTAALLGEGDAALLSEFKALRAAVESLERGQMDGFAAVATHAKTMATVLLNVTPDGDAVATRPAS